MSDRKAWDDRIDGALEAWPSIKAPDEMALAEKTLNRIRANFPPKSKLTVNDDALVGSPFPATADDHASQATPKEEWEDVSQDAAVAIAGPDVTLETHVNPFADVTQEIRPEAQRTLREKSRPDFTREEIRAATQTPNQTPNEDSRQPTENQHSREKSSQIDVPIARASSIPPPSSGVGTSQKKAEDRMGQVERQRDRTSFKDLAKLAATPPPPSTKPASAKVPVAAPSSSSGMKSDSGVVDLQAAALSDPQGAERAKSTPLASGSLFDEDAPHSGRGSVPPPSSGLSTSPISAAHSVPQQIDPYSPASVRPSVPPAALSAGRISAVPVSAGPHSAVAAMNQPQKTAQKKSRIGVVLFSLVGVAAVAAAGVFYVHTHHAAAVAAADTKSVQAPTQPGATQPAQNNAVAQADQPAAADTVSVDDPSLLAQNGAQNSTNPVAKSAKPVAHAGSKSGKPSGMLKDAMEKTESDTPSAPPPVADTKAADTKAGAKDEAPPAVGGSANLQNAMQTAAGPSDSTNAQATPTGPKFAPGSVPQRPSQGALASAIGRVLPDARSCLGPDDGVSYANIVFESGGSVQNVTLSGYAANKPAGACITTALKKGQVGPFAEPTYSAKVTVRP